MRWRAIGAFWLRMMPPRRWSGIQGEKSRQPRRYGGLQFSSAEEYGDARCAVFHSDSNVYPGVVVPPSRDSNANLDDPWGSGSVDVDPHKRAGVDLPDTCTRYRLDNGNTWP